MAYVPGCRYDLFISYARADNRDGWVEQFQNALGLELNQLLGRQFDPKESVYFDTQKLEVAQSFPAELAAAARDSAILITVLSPNYLTSTWCDRESTEFFSRLPEGAARENCLAPILIRPIDEDGLDVLFRRAERISFLSSDAQTPFPPGAPEWTAGVRKLAGQLKNALQRLRRGCKPIFIGKAAPTDRLQKLRASCCAELEKRHFRTVPESLQTFNDRDAVRGTLEQAGLGVHFLGGADAIALEAMEISAEVCSGPTILYQPSGAALSPDESLWVPEFEKDLPSTPGRYQRLAGKNDQDLLGLINDQITRARPSSETDVARLQLALVCEQLDLAGARQLTDEIRARRAIEVDFPSFLGSGLKAMDRVRKWQDFLSRGRALIFYQGLEQRERLESKWLKAEQDNRGAVRCWFLAQPDLEGKRQKNPDALWEIDQVISLVEQIRSAP